MADAIQTENIYVVLDGPPGDPACPGIFVELEDDGGRSLKLGEWQDRGDGGWALRIPYPSWRVALDTTPILPKLPPPTDEQYEKFKADLTASMNSVMQAVSIPSPIVDPDPIRLTRGQFEMAKYIFSGQGRPWEFEGSTIRNEFHSLPIMLVATEEESTLGSNVSGKDVTDLLEQAMAIPQLAEDVRMPRPPKADPQVWPEPTMVQTPASEQEREVIVMRKRAARGIVLMAASLFGIGIAFGIYLDVGRVQTPIWIGVASLAVAITGLIAAERATRWLKDHYRDHS